ncbi:MAG: hypothetical protein IGS03_04775 [Candidatus Sericytochromatia bacterium]|nr:hypothetical protein [Candidatus Sericytochromatia bacterium]
MHENPYNALLYWLSAKGKGSMEQFYRVCEQLQVPDRPHRARRNLQLLGHIEVKTGAGAWSIAPACWVRMPGEERWFLCGQRSARWQKQAALRITAQTKGPDRWESDQLLPDFGDSVTISDAGCTSEQLLQGLVPVNVWADNLNGVSLLRSASAYRIQRWNLKAQAFEPWQSLQFNRGIYQFSIDAGRYENRFTLYYHPVTGRSTPWLVAEFTGLRFINHYHEQLRPLGFRYNRRSQELWIPLSQGWPYIYERCLVLMQGLLPEIIRGPVYEDIGRLWLYYPWVPQHIAHQLGQLLSAKMIHTRETQHV